MKASVSAMVMALLVAHAPAAETRDIAPDIVSTVMEFDAAAGKPDEIDPIVASISVRKREGGFHLTIDGDHFDAVGRLLTQLCGGPIPHEIGADGDLREARYRSCVMLFMRDRGETVVFGFGRLPAAATVSHDRPAAIVMRVEPTYPAELRSRGVKGRVLVGFVVDSIGMVRDAYIIESTDEAFARPALQAVMKWRYIPAMVDGRLANAKVQEPIVFEIPNGTK